MMSALLARITPARLGAAAWAETLLLPLLALGVFHAVRPGDLLLIGEPIPWLWLIPLLLALRYGFASAAVGLLLLLAGWAMLAPMSTQTFPTIHFVGALLVALMCGEFVSLWRSRLRRMEELNLYLDQRLEKLSQRLHLTQISHDRLQQSLIQRPRTLNELLAELRELIDEHGMDEPFPALDNVMDCVTRFCQLEAAAIYAVENGNLAAKPLTARGSMPDLETSDPLIKHALQRRELTHVRSESIIASESRYLVAAPLRSHTNRMYAILLVHEMPFFALQRDNLQTLAVLLSYYAESIETARSAHWIRERLPACPSEFADEMFKLISLSESSGIASHVVVLTIPRLTEFPHLFRHLVEQKRNLDLVWEIHRDQSDTLITLMPLANAEAAQGYCRRLTRWLDDYGVKADIAGGIDLRTFDLVEAGNILNVQKLLEKQDG